MRRLLLLFALTGCDDGPVFLPYPAEIDEAHTLLLIERDPLSIEVMETAAKLSLEFDDRDAELYLLTYAQTPVELGLEAGSLAPGELCRACALAQPEKRYWSREGESFATLEETPEFLVEALVPDRAARCGACSVVLEAERLTLPFGPELRHFHLRKWDENSLVLISVGVGQLTQIHADGRMEPLCLADPAMAQVTTAFVSGDRVLWFIGAGGVLFSLPLDALEVDEPCGAGLVARGPPLQGAATRLVGPSDQNPPELFVLTLTATTSGSLYRFFDASWTKVASFESLVTEPSLAFSGESAYAVGGTDELLVARGAEVERLWIRPRGIPREVTLVEDVPDFGLVVGDRYEGLLRRDETGAFVALGQLQITEQNGARPRGVVAIAGGLLYGTSRGEVRYFDPHSGYCAAQASLFGRESAWNMHAVEGPVVFSGTANLYRAVPANTCGR